MEKVEKIINGNSEDPKSSLELIKKYGFVELLNEIFNKIDDALEQNKQEELKRIAIVYLVKVNEKMRCIEQEDKRSLEYLFRCMFRSVLSKLSQLEVANEVREALIGVCQTGGYDFKELEGLLDLNDYFPEKGNACTERKQPYYQWCGYDYELDGLIKMLKENKVLFKVKGFKKMFAPIDGHCEYEGNRKKIRDLIVVFDILKNINLIKPKVLSGHFTALERYGIDIDMEFLFKKAPNKIHETLKKDREVYVRLRERYEKTIRDIASKTFGQRGDNG